jgi:hypothetical protein
LDYSGVLTQGVRTVPEQGNLADWRSDYTRTAVMIYNEIPSFDVLMEFAQHLELEFNSWVVS